MKIGELSKRSGLPASRIRFYEASGVLDLADRQLNGYRDYPEDALLMLHLVTRAQRAGFSLDEIRTLLPCNPAQLNAEHFEATLKFKIAEIEVLQQRLAETKSELLMLLAMAAQKPTGMSCFENAKRLMSEIGRMDQMIAE